MRSRPSAGSASRRPIAAGIRCFNVEVAIVDTNAERNLEVLRAIAATAPTGLAAATRPAPAASRCRSPIISGRAAPASVTPIVSSRTSLARRCTDSGMSSQPVRAMNCASFSICSPTVEPLSLV